jgi:hypothetical protein
MKLLVPKPITAARIAAGTTIAEPAAGETLWVSGGTYALGDKRIRVETHRVYEAVQASTGRTIAPELDGTYWKDMGPTLRWAPFDQLRLVQPHRPCVFPREFAYHLGRRFPQKPTVFPPLQVLQ